MAFRNSNAQRNTAQSNDDWKAAGFINIYISRKDGSKAKLGAIPLRMVRDNEAQLFEWLKSNENNIEKLAKALIIDFRSVQKGEGGALDLPA